MAGQPPVAQRAPGRLIVIHTAACIVGVAYAALWATLILALVGLVLGHDWGVVMAIIASLAVMLSVAGSPSGWRR